LEHYDPYLVGELITCPPSYHQKTGWLAAY
jgi:hypothetical protein